MPEGDAPYVIYRLVPEENENMVLGYPVNHSRIAYREPFNEFLTIHAELATDIIQIYSVMCM
jgi:hypothetical protein